MTTRSHDSGPEGGRMFDPQLRTADDFLRALWRDMQTVKAQGTTTNDRVTRLERVAWAAGGAIAVLAMVVVPIFLDLIARP